MTRHVAARESAAHESAPQLCGSISMQNRRLAIRLATLWIEDPQRVLPGNAMPTMGIPEKDARDMTAFLYGLK